MSALKVAILGHHPDVFPGFNALMTANFAWGFAQRGHEVTVLLPETETHPLRERMARKKLSLDSLDRFAPNVELVPVTDGAVPGRYDLGVWQTYFPADQVFWKEFRRAAHVTTKNFPRLFTTEPERDRHVLARVTANFDIVCLALEADMDIVRQRLRADKGTKADRCIFAPRGFRADWFTGPSLDGPPVIGVEKGVSSDGSEYAYIVPVVDELRKIHRGLEVIGARIRDPRLVTRSISLLPAHEFYRQFLDPLWAYIMIDITASRQSRNALGVDGRWIYPGLYENQLVEAQMAGAVVVGHEEMVPAELTASERTALRFSSFRDTRRIVDFLDAAFRDRARRAEEARAWAIANHSVDRMVAPVLEAFETARS